jgi:hypothetical protein
VNRWLKPGDYDLQGPNRGGMRAPPFSLSDFAPAAGAPADDDIPF